MLPCYHRCSSVRGLWFHRVVGLWIWITKSQWMECKLKSGARLARLSDGFWIIVIFLLTYCYYSYYCYAIVLTVDILDLSIYPYPSIYHICWCTKKNEARQIEIPRNRVP